VANNVESSTFAAGQPMLSQYPPVHAPTDNAIDVGSLLVDGDRTALDFLGLVDTAALPHGAIGAVRLDPADESSSPSICNLKPDMDTNTNNDLTLEQRKRMGDFVLAAALGTDDRPSAITAPSILVRASDEYADHLFDIDTGYCASRTGPYCETRNEWVLLTLSPLCTLS
jgi:hypothetical protein